MDLHKKWDWEKRKLACKVRIETGNPGADELRERICELLGMDYVSFQRHFLADKEKAIEKTLAPTKEDKKDKDKVEAPAARQASVQAALRRINTSLQLFNQSDAVRPATSGGAGAAGSAEEHGMPMHRRNINKKFIEVPKSPPRRALYDLKMDRLNMAVALVAKQAADTDPNALEGVEEAEGEVEGEHAAATSTETAQASRAELESQNKRKMRKLQVKMLSEPLLDKAAMETMSGPKPDPSKLFKPYNGDIFGTETTESGGMIYLSRMAPRQKRGRGATKATDSPAEVPPAGSGNGVNANRPPASNVGNNTTGSLEVTTHPLDYTPDPSVCTDDKLPVAPSQKEIQAKIHCAQTLCNWTQYNANTERLYKEGAVQAIMRLSKESDRTIRKYCATAFRQMSTRPPLAKQLVQLGAVPVISELISSAGKAKQIVVDCTVALVNLTKNVGTEGKLVEDGIVLALTALPNDTEEWDELCARGLFNLTCVDTSYPFMERVIKAFMSLASSSFPSVKYICASALCNIADLKQMRMRMVEEGVIQVLGMLSRGADIKTRRLCAIIIHSLAANKSVRAEMASRGAIQVIYGLSADNDMTTLYCSASSILRLSAEEANASRLISEGGISAISNVAIRCADVSSTSQACAGTLHILSTRPEQRSVIVQEGCIPALITMLRTSVDYLTLHYSVLAVCNLLTVEDNQVHILQQGGVQTIVQLCRHEHQGIQKSCAFAIFTLSCVEAARKQAAACGAIPVIISLAKVADEQMQMFCAATLCMMSCDTDNIPVMVREGVIQTFIDLLQSTNTSTIRYSCAALCCLAYNNSSCMHVLEQGAVPHVVAGALNGDTSTRQSCCAVISALSTHPECRQQLCDMNVLPALVCLSGMDDEMTRLRCAVAFANLSCEATAQELMVKHGVVPILSELSISYSEENQIYCAKALCNLACHIGSEKAIVDQGGMAALMMIGMVRTVNPQTKQICAKAILNLLMPHTVNRVVEDGLVTACSSLCKMDDEATIKACAYIFCVMSLEPLSREKLAAKVSALHGLFRLMRSTDPTTKALVGKAVCNLLSFEDSRVMTVAEGGIEVLKEIAMSGETEPELYCAETFYRICDDERCRQKLIESRTLPVIILLARSPNEPTRCICVRMLCLLAWHFDSRAALLQTSGVGALVSILRREAPDERIEDKKATADLCVRALFYLSLNIDQHEAIVRDGIIPALLEVHHQGLCSAPAYEFMALTVRNLTDTTTVRAQLLRQGALTLICSTAKLLSQSSEIMVASAVCLYNLALDRSSLNADLVTIEVLEVVRLMSRNGRCVAVLSALLYILSLEGANRVLMVNNGIPDVLHDFLQEPGDDDTLVVTQNCCATVLMLSKSPECRGRMQQASLVPSLIRLSKSKDAKICDSASQALNCLSENSTEGMEEGTVAALIAIALDGNAASQTELDAEDYLKVPDIPKVEVHAYAPRAGLEQLSRFKGLEAHPQKMPAGPAGKGGPKPPKPPSMMNDKKAIGIPGASGFKAEEELALDAPEEEVSTIEKILVFAKLDLPLKFVETEFLHRQNTEDEDSQDGDLKKVTINMEESPPKPEQETPIVGTVTENGGDSKPAGKLSQQTSSLPLTRQGTVRGARTLSSKTIKRGPLLSRTAARKPDRPTTSTVAPPSMPPEQLQPSELQQTTAMDTKMSASAKHGSRGRGSETFPHSLDTVRQPLAWEPQPTKISRQRDSGGEPIRRPSQSATNRPSRIGPVGSSSLSREQQARLPLSA